MPDSQSSSGGGLPDRRRCLDEDTAHRVWDLLVEKAGANEDARADAVRYLSTPSTFGHEFRFMGLLGFGGKVRFSDLQGAHIDCYPEDYDDVRGAVIAHVNKRLAEIVPDRATVIRRAAGWPA